MKNSNGILGSISNPAIRRLAGQFKFDDEQLGKVLESKDGKRYIIFRDLRKKDFCGLNEGSSVFIVTFRFANFSLKVNKALSMIPSLFLMGKKGFHRKIWACTEDGHFMGIYRWKTAEDAYAYPNSFIFMLMTKRAAKGSIRYHIIENTKFEDYIKELTIKIDWMRLIRIIN